MTHMPFLMADRDGLPFLFFCRSDAVGLHGSRVWKLACLIDQGKPSLLDSTVISRLDTGFGPEVCECSPSAWHDETGWHVSFVAGGAEYDPTYRLYRMDGTSLGKLSTPVAVHPARTGFIHRSRLVWGERENLIHVRDRSACFDIELPGATISRVSYRADAPQTLVITGLWERDGQYFTLEYNLDTGAQFLVEVDGRPAYKCTVYGTQVVDAHRIAGGFEERRIVTATNVVRRAVHVAVRYLLDRSTAAQPVQAAGGCGCQATRSPTETITRPSCLECVEKHLGAAYVLLTETRDGYAYRLRAVGHLHEAEDESQEWMALHAAIRAARKAYQVQGAMPDWQSIESLVEAARAVPAN